MKTWKEYSSLHFPEGYIKVGDCIDIDLAMQLTDRERDAYDEYEDWDEGINQGKHPVDVIGGKGVYETICRENVYTPFRYLGQCYAGESTNRNPALGRKIYICSRYAADTEEQVQRNVAIAKDYCRMVADRGDFPIAPHLYFPQFLNDAIREERSAGLRMGMEALRHADHVLAIIENGVISSGMDQEMREAARLGIPVEMIYIGETPGKKEKR